MNFVRIHMIFVQKWFPCPVLLRIEVLSFIIWPNIKIKWNVGYENLMNFIGLGTSGSVLLLYNVPIPLFMTLKNHLATVV